MEHFQAKTKIAEEKKSLLDASEWWRVNQNGGFFLIFFTQVQLISEKLAK